MKDVVIVGGGIAGLSTAYNLNDQAGQDIETLLVEKNNRLGGNIFTEKIDGFVIEGGPDCFLSEKPWALEMCKKLGLEDDLLCTNDEKRKTFVLWKGRLHELPEGVILMIPTKMVPLIMSPLLSLHGKLRMGLEMFIPRRRSEEDESLADFVLRRLGQETLERIAEPLIAGIHAGSPETLSIRSTFPKFVELEDKYGSLIRGMIARMKIAGKTMKGRKGKNRITMFMSLKDGLIELIDTITSTLDIESILLDKRLIRVEKKGSQSSDTPVYCIHLEDGTVIETRAIVLSTPAYESARLLKGLDGSLSEELSNIPYVSTATVSLAYKRSTISHPLDGFGFVVPRAEKRRIMACTWTSVKFSNRAPEDSVLIRCFVGGVHNKELVSLDDKAMTKMVREELKDIMGIDAEPVLTRAYKWKDAMPQYIIGHREKVLRIEERLSHNPGLFLNGGAYNGKGISDCIHSGDLTARKVLEYIRK
ncbi:MAG: protoporphyrinogen oxidase [Thermodesulfobacteriota bacterium]